MQREWILIAHRSGARLFEKKIQKGFALIKEFTHPEGRRNGSAKAHTPVDRIVSTPESVTRRFARQLSKVLENGRSVGKYNRLILVAEPKFLGVLRSVLSPHTLELVTATVPRDYAEFTEHTVFDKLRKSVLI